MEGIAAAGVVLVLGIALKVLAGVVLLGIGVAFAFNAVQKWKAKEEPVAASAVSVAAASAADASQLWHALRVLRPLLLKALKALKDDGQAQAVCKALLDGLDEIDGLKFDPAKLPIPLTGNIVADLTSILHLSESSTVAKVKEMLAASNAELSALKADLAGIKTAIDGLLHKGS